MKKTLDDFPDLTPAEQTLRDGVGSGVRVGIGDGTLPDEDAGPDREIRASFLRYLALGGCDKCRPSEKGVELSGAVILSDGPSGAETRGLDLESCEVFGDLGLFNCLFPDIPLLRGTRLGSLFLNGSKFPKGLSADRLEARGGAFLGDVQAKGAVRLLNAQLGGNLDCKGARFEAVADAAGAMGDAFSADGLEARGDAFLRGVQAKGAVRLLGAKLGGDLDCVGARFEAVADADGAMGDAFSTDRLEARGDAFLRGLQAKGEVRLLGAKLGGNLDCDGARFEAVADAAGAMGDAFSADGLEARGDAFLRGVQAKGAVRLLGAKLGGNLDCKGARFEAVADADSLSLVSARVSGGLYLGSGVRIKGRLNLTNALFSGLVDEVECWPSKGNLYLDRCEYGAFLGNQTPKDAVSRLNWLALGPDNPQQGEFSPQPYEQLAKVLREDGRRADARKVLQTKEKLQRQAAQARRPNVLTRAWDETLGATIGYGYQTSKAVWWLLGFFAIGVIAYQAAYDRGAFKPNNAFVLRSAEWVLCAKEAPKAGWTSEDVAAQVARNVEGFDTQLDCFVHQPEAKSYPVFNPWTYSADTLLPIVSLEMQEYWIPDASNEPRGKYTRWFLWIQIAAGWALSLLAVAGFSGLVKGDR